MTSEKKRKPRVGISSCLLGEQVRYNGGHKGHPIIMEIVGPQVEWVPLCPEVEVGMGIPREPVNLVGSTESPAMIQKGTGKNWSKPMTSYAAQKTLELQRCRLSGYIFKKSSPSCGLREVRVYEDRSLNQWVSQGIGVFVRELLLKFPGLLVVDEDELSTQEEADLFLEKITRYHRFQRSSLDKD